MDDAQKSRERLIEELRLLRAAQEAPSLAPQEILDLLGQLVYVHDIVNDRFEYVSPNAPDWLGMTAEEFKAVTDEELFRRMHPEDIQLCWQTRQRLVQATRTDPNTSETVEHRWFNGDRYVWLRHRIRMDVDAEGNLIRECGIMEDITAARETVESLRASQNQYDSLIAGAEDCILVVNQQLRLVSTNPSARMRFGEGKDRLGDLLPDDTALAPQISAVLDDGEPRRFEWRVGVADGSRRWFSVVCSPIHGPHDQVTAVTVIARDITETKLAEQSLRDTERRFQEALDNSQSVLYRFDVLGDRMEYISPIASRQTGWSLDQLLSHGMEDMRRGIHPDDWRNLERTIAEASQRKESPTQVDVEYRRLGIDGEYYWLRDTATLFFTPEGQLQTVIGSAQDITARRQAELRLRNVERERELLLQSISEVVLYLDRQARIVWCNRAAVERVSAESTASLVGTTCLDFWQPRRPTEGCPALQAIQDGEPQTSEVLSRDGRSWLVHAYPVRDEEGHVVGIAQVGSDITEQRRAEQDLHESRENLRGLLRAMPDILFVLSPEGRYLDIHTGHPELLASRPEELVGHTIHEALPAEVASACQAVIDKAMAEDTPQRMEYTVRTIEGKDRWFSAMVVRVPQEGELRALWVARDITPRKLAEEALRDSEAKTRALLDAMPDLMFLLAEDGTFLDYHAGRPDLLLVPPEEFLGRRLQDCIPANPAEQIAEAMQTAMETGALQTCQYSVEILGQPRHYEARVVRVDEERVLVIARNVTAREEAERARAESEQRYRTVSELATDFAYSLRLEDDGTHTFEWTTDAIQRVTGYTGQEMTWLPRERYAHPDDLPGVQRRFERLRKGVASTAEFRIIRKDGAVRWLRDVAMPVWDEAHTRVIRLVGAAQDVTERREAQDALQRAMGELETRVRERTADLQAANEQLREEAIERQRVTDALRASEHALRQVLDLVPHHIHAKGTDGRFLMANSAVSKSFGLSAEQLIGKRHFDLAANKDQARQMLADDREVIESGRLKFIPEEPFTDANGQIHWLQTTKVPFDYYGQQAVLICAVDITAQKLAQEALAKSERNFRVLAESIDTAIFIHNEGQIVYANRAAEHLTGYRREELQGVDGFEALPEQMRLNVARGGQPSESTGPATLETQIVNRTGAEHWLSVSAAEIVYDGQACTLTTAVDVTERYRAEQQLREAHRKLLGAREGERRAVAGELHDSVAQDLVVLQLTLQQCLAQPEPAAWLDQATSLCAQAIREIRNICQGLYPAVLETLGLWQALQSFEKFYEATPAKVRVNSVGPAPEERLRPDLEIALFRIAQEAISNGIRHGRASDIEVRLELTGGRAILEVQDNGSGFDPEAAKGPGVGLLSMRDRVAAVGGQLDIHSQPGRTLVRATAPCEVD